MANIALVDDDKNILTSVSIALEAEGHKISTYTDGATALEGLASKNTDLAILDIKMPRMDGMELLRRLRQTSKLPVIFLTSKEAEIDEIFGLKMGADDFITKPFSQKVLVERVKTVLRRTVARRNAIQQNNKAQNDDGVIDSLGADNAFRRGNLQMDIERHECLWKNKSVSLTVTEFQLLMALAQRPGIVKSRDQLMNEAYNDQIYVDDRTIDSHIKRLRKKFKNVDKSFEKIETLYGVGYRFKEDCK